MQTLDFLFDNIMKGKTKSAVPFIHRTKLSLVNQSLNTFSFEHEIQAMKSFFTQKNVTSEIYLCLFYCSTTVDFFGILI